MTNEKRIYGDPKNNRKSNSILLGRCCRLLEYLKHNTDKNHTITQAQLRNDLRISDYIGSKSTFNSMMQNLAIAINTDINDNIKPEEEWRLVYRAFRNFYGESDDFEDDDPRFVKDIYYNHIFTEEEITEIINALRMSKTADNNLTEKIIGKIKNELVSKHYNECSCRIYNSENTDSENLKINLAIVQKAISKSKQISYIMNYYDSRKQLVSVRNTKKTISPHYIVTNGGRFYIIGCFENSNDSGKKLCIIRIDLMSDITIERTDSTPTNHIPALRRQMKNEFKTQHLSMSYDDSAVVTMRITKKVGDEINYTFIHDSFGDDYRFKRSDNDGDIIEVRCSRFGIINWALQYSDAVEVLSPENVRDEIKARIEMLRKKYDN